MSLGRATHYIETNMINNYVSDEKFFSGASFIYAKHKILKPAWTLMLFISYNNPAGSYNAAGFVLRGSVECGIFAAENETTYFLII